MDRVATPLNQMGLRVEGRGSTVRPPLHVTREAGELRATTFTSPVASAQVKSAVILAALQGDAPSEVSELTRTRANTEEMLQRAGIRVDVIDHDDRRTVRVTPGRPNPVAWRVPADPSQGAFFVVAALAHVDAEICVVDLYGGVERIGFLRVLERMGADLSVTTHDSMITVVARSSPLRATTVWSHEIPSVDEVPVLAVAAAAAVGVTRFVDVGELRVKESDRFSAVLTMLELIGVNAYGEGDDLVIEGVGTAEQFRSFSFAGALDHRMVMAAAVAGTVGHGVQITNSQTVTSSYPEFFDHLASLQ
jgi:3-phosphoshikimate 1-carboxyvinyltransferase